MQLGGVGMNPFGGGLGGSSPPGAGQAVQDLQDQKAQNAFQEQIAKESNMEAKRNQTRMAVIANLK